MTTEQQQRLHRLLPYILSTAALCFLVSLLITVKEEVFFSGDAGLKFLMVKQIAHGGSCTTLDLQNAQWVNNIWNQGFYPFKPPFIYDAPDGKVVSFPPSFQWLTSWMYKWFGFKGIYIIPSFSVAALWYWFITVLYKAGVAPLRVSAAFFLLAFCSPLTVYGALYWEHSMAIVLLFSAIVFMLKQVSALQAVTLGLMSGLSVWFRPEMLMLCLLLIVTVAVNSIIKKSNANVLFVIAMLLCISAFFIFNFKVYDSVLGAHSYQLFEQDKFVNYFVKKFIISTHLNGRLVIYFPLVVLLYAFSVYLLFQKKRLPDLVNQLTLLIIIFLMLTPFCLPNAGGKQWGPRYFLPVIPVVIVTLSLAARYYSEVRIRKHIAIGILFIAAYSMYINVYLAHRTLHDDYACRVKPALDYLKNERCNILVVQNQYIAQEFASLFENKKIFLAESQQNFDELKHLLIAAGITKVMYLSHDGGFERQPVNVINNSAALKKTGDYYVAQYDLR